MRILLAALAGAVASFAVSAVLHMATPLGSMGLRSLPDEAPVAEALRAHVRESGAYMVPGMDMSHQPSAAEQKAWEEKATRGPYGLLIVTPQGGGGMSGTQLGLEFLTVLLSALIGAFILSFVRGGYLLRASIVALLAVFTFLSVSVSHWIWYRFPIDFVAAEAVMEVVAWLAAGLAMAKIVRPRALA
ncbi:MAG TPA: hypothetical protein VF824_15620 [Thermoanaerobaculia bacterium]|jgi:hypothetical protein